MTVPIRRWVRAVFSLTDSELPIMDGITSGENDDLYQIALLIDQLKHDDVTLRTNASKNITKIGKSETIT